MLGIITEIRFNYSINGTSEAVALATAALAAHRGSGRSPAT